MLKNIWNWLDGKKRIIGGVIIFVGWGLRGLKLIDDEVLRAIDLFGGTVMAVGIGDAVRKML